MDGAQICVGNCFGRFCIEPEYVQLGRPLTAKVCFGLRIQPVDEREAAI
jgi:hypothetical protein